MGILGGGCYCDFGGTGLVFGNCWVGLMESLIVQIAGGGAIGSEDGSKYSVETRIGT